jgi:hypothetical protein
VIAVRCPLTNFEYLRHLPRSRMHSNNLLDHWFCHREKQRIFETETRARRQSCALVLDYEMSRKSSFCISHTENCRWSFSPPQRPSQHKSTFSGCSILRCDFLQSLVERERFGAVALVRENWELRHFIIFRSINATEALDSGKFMTSGMFLCRRKLNAQLSN